LVKRPIIIAPFVILAFFEILALVVIYFFPQEPIAYVAGPIIRKFFGEAFNHYPGSLILLPKLFYYSQILVYALLGVCLVSITIDMTRKVKTELPIKAKALIKSALSRYLAFVMYGILFVAGMILLKRVNSFLFFKLISIVAQYLPDIVKKIIPFALSFSLFIGVILFNTFFMMTIPVIVIKKISLLKALLRSIYLGGRYFFTIMPIICVPYFIYLPILLLKSFPAILVSKTFPEINFLIAITGSIVALFIEAFVIVCLSQFLLDIDKDGSK